MIPFFKNFNYIAGGAGGGGGGVAIPSMFPTGEELLVS